MKCALPVLLSGALLASAAMPANACDPDAGVSADLKAAIAGDWRDPANVARDKYRHPAATLAFFGVHPDDTVVEITPGGGWYAEVLAPYLRDDGAYVAAVWDDAIPDQPGYRYRLNTALRAKSTRRNISPPSSKCSRPAARWASSTTARNRGRRWSR